MDSALILPFHYFKAYPRQSIDRHLLVITVDKTLSQIQRLAFADGGF